MLVVPSIAALTAANYEGRARALLRAARGYLRRRDRRRPADRRLGDDGVHVRYFRRQDRRVIVILLVRGQIARAPVAERRPPLPRRGRARGAAIAASHAATADHIARGDRGRWGGANGSRLGAYDVYSGSRSARMIRPAASMSARWEKAWGKLPRCRPVLVSNSSAYRPSGEATLSRRSMRSRARCSSPTMASADTSQNEQIRKLPSLPDRPSSVSSVR